MLLRTNKVLNPDYTEERHCKNLYAEDQARRINALRAANRPTIHIPYTHWKAFWIGALMGSVMAMCVIKLFEWLAL